MSRIISGVEIYGAPSEHAYHYTTSGSAFVHILPRHELRFSRLSEMRDPIQNKDWVHVLLGSPAWSVEKVRELEAVANAVAYETKILSFTLDGSTEGRRTEYARGYARPRMWEQYGQNHEGVCLVFDHERLRFQVDEQCAAFAQGAEQRRAMSDTVVYNDMPLPGHEVWTIPRRNRIALEGAGDYKRGLENYLEKHAPELFFRKLLDWQTEQEYRYVVMGDESGRMFVDYADTLRAVIVGARFPEWQVAGAAKVCQDAGVELRKMRWGARAPGVVDPRGDMLSGSSAATG